jgi:hypothetical protein
MRKGIGKQFVVKHYAHGTVLSAYPDMSKVKHSKLQKTKQEVFARRLLMHDPLFTTRKKRNYLRKS